MATVTQRHIKEATSYADVQKRLRKNYAEQNKLPAMNTHTHTHTHTQLKTKPWTYQLHLCTSIVNSINLKVAFALSLKLIS